MQRVQIEGELVYFRGIEREDIDRGWLDWMNDITVTRYLARPLPTTRDDLEEYYKQSQWPNAVMFAVCDKEDDRYIGNARLSSFDWIARTCQYGRILDPSYSGRGLGRDALITLLRYGFHRLGINRIYSGAIASNERSLASNDSVGMVREGVARQSHFVDGQFCDSVYLSMLRSDFDTVHGGPDAWSDFL